MALIVGARDAVTVAVLLIVVAMTTGYVIHPPSPVPPTTPGIVYNPSAIPARVRLEVFIEVHCPDSRDAWPIMKSVAQYYGAEKLELLVQQLPLPYHRNALLATQGIFVIRDSAPDKVFDYIEANLQNWANFSTASTVNKTETEVLDSLADLATTSTGIDKTLFKSSIESFRSYTVMLWKYGIRRAVAAVPVFFVNGVELGIGNNKPTFDEWITFLDPIVNSSSRFNV
jgi:sRNA-binding regulator protein Hfq